MCVCACEIDMGEGRLDSLPECVAVAAGELPPLQRLLSCVWMLLRNDAASSNGRDSSSLYRTSTPQYDSWITHAHVHM